MTKLRACWKNRDILLIGAFLLGVILVYALVGENSYIAVHDNLDLFQAQFQMMKNEGIFFAHHVDAPFLHGISRDVLPSEWSLTTLLYVIFPSFAAYVINYILKVLIAILSFWLLGTEIWGDKARDYRALILLAGMAYGIVNVFPAFGIPFASIPLAIYLWIRIERAETVRKALPWYVALFAYPFVSYFSYFGLFLCGYLLAAAIWVSIAKKKVSLKLLAAVPVLGLGYVAFEYRLFGQMLFSDQETIRSAIAGSELGFGEMISEILDVFAHGIFHADGVHTRLILPLCLIWFVVQNIVWILGHEGKKIGKDLLNLVMLLLVFNSIVYGLYDFAPVRELVEQILPPLKGWQFNRTIFFNPFLWYAALLLVAVRIKEAGEQVIRGYIAEGLILASMAIVLISPTRYNDLLSTCYKTALHEIKGKTIDEMNYREFYGTTLFEQIKTDLDYQGEWSVAYGFHPAVLEYNGIATLDGYLGFYSMDYKRDFRAVIAPAIERVEASRINFDDWGARAYLYSGTQDSVTSNYRSFVPGDTDLYLDPDAFRAIDGTYLFSRFELTRLDECEMEYIGAWSDETIPYEVYVYRVKQ